MKKLITLLLLLALLASILVGCTGGSVGNWTPGTNGTNGTTSTTKPPEVTQTDVLTGTGDDELAYVMIYNPKVYSENQQYHSDALSTGYLGTQVDTDASRADGLPEGNEIMIDRIDWNLPEDFEPEDGHRGDILVDTYTVGQQRQFYVFSKDMTRRSKESFTCSYAGEHCYIWTQDNSISQSVIMSLGREFDNNIYSKTVETFGESRIGAAGGKVCIMLYSLYQYYGGFFTYYDAYTSNEYSQTMADYYTLNLNHDMIHVNVDQVMRVGVDEFYSTLAHEFQHLICFSNAFSTYGGVVCESWLNEAMSAYIEEKLYPGIQYTAGRHRSYNTSNLIRNGQSLYNFTTEINDLTGVYDIGVYGSVNYYAAYLSNLGGTDVFSNLHEYWRESYSPTLDVAEAIANALPANVRNQVDSFIDYPYYVYFTDDSEELMSKLTLMFYLDMLQNPRNYQGLDLHSILYDQIGEANIEGGGRIILAVKNGTFKIPTDAEGGLIYIGLNKNFEVITSFVINP